METKPITLPDEDSSQWEYAGFFWRMLAGFLDTILLLASIAMLAIIFRFIFQQLSLIPSGGGLTLIGLIIISIPVICWLYYARFESSVWQASPGKKLCRMVVVNSDGSRLSFGDASYRFLLNMFRAPPIVDDGMIIFTKKRQDLEDIVSDTYVLRRKVSE